ncbi:MAG TPA: Uma2 family endonuclease [Thermoanaerobaculia bacterium]|nr:Uma2 family endonuclease [Thermoanaerobaculia bacterium]
MAPSPAVIFEEDLIIPAGVSDLDLFRQWTREESFPEHGRIDYLAGTVEVDLSPEDLYTHGVVKTAITARLYPLIVDTGRGSLFSDSTRIVSPKAGLSAEPDVIVVLWESLRQGRIREIPGAKGEEGRFVELEGAPDLIVEIVSDSSERKDLERLPRLYAAAGVPELWLVDARGKKPAFAIHVLGSRGYKRQPADAEGWCDSRLLDRRVRLVRWLNDFSRWAYDLKTEARKG